MCSDLFTNSLNYLQTISNPISSTPTNEQSSRIKPPSKTTKLNVFTNYLQTITNPISSTPTNVPTHKVHV